MSESYTLTDVIMTQSYGMKNNMPSTANNGQLLIARVNDGISELWGGTGSGVELLSGAKVDLSNLNQNGEAHFANPSLNNLDSLGEAHFQVPLISGTNIKTINSESILGSGNINIAASIVPDYSTKTSVASGYVATEYCFVSNYGEQGYNGSTYMDINGVRVWITGGGLDASQGTTWLSGLYLVKPGDKITGSGGGHKIYKYKILGA